jgi:hypothetical protein
VLLQCGQTVGCPDQNGESHHSAVYRNSCRRQKSRKSHFLNDFH